MTGQLKCICPSKYTPPGVFNKICHVAKILPPVSRFTPTGERTQKRETVTEKIKAFFNRFWDISGGVWE